MNTLYMNNYQEILENIIERNKSKNDPKFLLEELLDFTNGLNNYINKTISNPVSFNEASNLFLDKLNSIENTDFIPTGIKDLDNPVLGFNKGEFIVIGGRPGMGKSFFLINLLVNMAKNNTKCAYFTLDFSLEMLTKKILASITKIPHSNLQKSVLTPDQINELQKSIQDLSDLPILMDDKSTNIFDIKLKCEKLHQEGKLEVVFVDYLQLLSVNNRRNSTRDYEISMITKELKNLARKLNICIITTSQLSRSVETRGGDKRPMLSDLRESGAIEQDADKVCFLYRPEYYDITEDVNGYNLKGIMEIIFAKNRNGALRNLCVAINNDFTEIMEITAFKTVFEQINPERFDDFN